MFRPVLAPTLVPLLEATLGGGVPWDSAGGGADSGATANVRITEDALDVRITEDGETRITES